MPKKKVIKKDIKKKVVKKTASAKLLEANVVGLDKDLGDLVIKATFNKTISVLAGLENVESVVAASAPAAFRWLTKGNNYINLGIEIVDDDNTKLVRNINSFSVPNTDVLEAHKAITKAVNG